MRIGIEIDREGVSHIVLKGYNVLFYTEYACPPEAVLHVKIQRRWPLACKHVPNLAL